MNKLSKKTQGNEANTLLVAGWLNPKSNKPHLGQKVLVKMQWKSGVVDYNVAIYAINENRYKWQHPAQYTLK